MIDRLRCFFGHRDVALRWRDEDLELYDCRACGAVSPVFSQFIEKPHVWDAGIDQMRERAEADRRARIAARHGG